MRESVVFEHRHNDMIFEWRLKLDRVLQVYSSFPLEFQSIRASNWIERGLSGQYPQNQSEFPYSVARLAESIAVSLHTHRPHIACGLRAEADERQPKLPHFQKQKPHNSWRFLHPRVPFQRHLLWDFLFGVQSRAEEKKKINTYESFRHEFFLLPKS